MESITQFLHWLEKTPVAIFVSQSPGGFSGLLMIHVGAAVIVFGMIVVVDLRLLGLASKGCSVTDLCREALPWTWTAFIISAITGVMLFTGQPVKYFANYAFQAKVALMALAGINMLVFQFMTIRSVSQWNRAPRIPVAAKLAGAISLSCWIAVVAYGRWTAFVM
ncbi:MAG TPA: DUF6644 family protein [Xanthobacteraceae bacterium]|nr:DUF6644 family protein [Xanthobacteraceae bacterium]